ncbi:MAG TPA: ATP synthase F1 subunit delta [Thermoanaerobaculia bacterium]|jgi:F-type H+-transporting ATPase subunit delta
MIRRFARPYARAIMDAAGSPQEASKLRGELLIFANALRESKELRDLYANPIDEATKLDITRQIARKMKASDLATRTLEVLLQHHRINDIDAIVDALQSYVNAALGVAIAEVRSAKPLGPEEIRQLADTLSNKVGKKVELDIKTDPTLLGGFVVKIGSEIWDASVAGKINKFRESLA